MNQIPREKLIEIIREYGHSLCQDTARCKALLLDICGQYRGEINILIQALNEGVTKELKAASKGIPKEIVLNKLKKKLEANLGMTEEAAQWTVETWALALSVITEEELTATTATTKRPQYYTEGILIPTATEKTIEVSPVETLASAPSNIKRSTGLYDVHGNVWEWCEDTWHDNYQGAPTDGSAWVDNGDRLLRGGSWFHSAKGCRCANRSYYSPAYKYGSYGFRVVFS